MKTKLKIISTEMFKVSLVIYLIFILIESFREGFVSMFFNITILLAVTSVSGIVIVLMAGGVGNRNKRHLAHRSQDLFIPIYAGISTGILVYIKIRNIGILSLFVSAIAAIVSYYLLINIDSD